MSDYCDIIIDASFPDKAEVYRTIFHIIETRRKNWSLISLDEVPEDSGLFHYISGTTVHKFSGITFCSDCSYVDTVRPWEEYSVAIFSKGMRQRHRNLMKCGTIAFGQISELEDVEPFMNALFETHIRRWVDTESPSRFRENSQRAYFTDMAKSLFPRGMVDLSYLSVNGTRVAFHFGFRDNDRLYIYLHTFDPKLQQYSVGRLFLYYLIKNSYDKYKYVDFLRGSESYKAHFDLASTRNYRFGFYKSGVHMWIHSKLGAQALVQ